MKPKKLKGKVKFKVEKVLKGGKKALGKIEVLRCRVCGNVFEDLDKNGECDNCERKYNIK